MKQAHAQLDHVVVVAASLAEGVDWCERTLGVTPGPGGEHPLMGTHNRLLAISSDAFADVFFEILAINPAAPPPARARWFGLDALDLSDGPRLVNLVARSDDLDTHLAALEAVGARPGRALAASRDTARGRLSWRIAVADDGALDGALPTLMQWDDLAQQPARHLPARGVQLVGATLRGLPAPTAQALNLARVATTGETGVDPGAADAAAATAARSPLARASCHVELDTPRGRVRLSSR